jgi:hypothetical protein
MFDRIAEPNEQSCTVSHGHRCPTPILDDHALDEKRSSPGLKGAQRPPFDPTATRWCHGTFGAGTFSKANTQNLADGTKIDQFLS